MGIAGMIIGILALVGALLATIPCLGALNWIIIPLALAGLIISCISVAGRSETRGMGIAGLILNIISMIWGIIRLVIGGGVV